MKKNILLSYPRSGNTWLRYCIEFLSKRPTIGYTGVNASNFDKNSLGYYNRDMGVDLKSNPILIKRHMTGFGYGKLTHTPDWTTSDKLILVVRNYKEVIIRHNKGRKDIGVLESSCESHIISKNYTQLIDYYHNFSGEKLLIYYEDLITDLRETLKQICNFIEIDEKHLNDFIENVGDHKKKSIGIYGQSSTKGKNTKSHSIKLSDGEKIEWDNFIKNKLGDLSNQYLSRYYEVQD